MNKLNSFLVLLMTMLLNISTAQVLITDFNEGEQYLGKDEEIA